MRGWLAALLVLVFVLPAQAEPLREQAAFEAAKAEYGPDDDRTLAAEIQLASVLAARDDYAAAVAHLKHFREVIVVRSGEDAPEALIAVAALAPAMAQSGDRDGALRVASDAYERAKPRGENDPVVMMVRTGLGSVLLMASRFDDALPHLKAGYEGMAAMFGPSAVQTRQVGGLLVDATYAAGLRAEGLAIRRRIAAPPGTGAGLDEQLMAAGYQLDLLDEEERYREVRDLGEALVPRLTELRGPSHSSTLQAKARLSSAYAELGELQRAIALRREVYEAFVRLRGANDLNALRHGEMLAHYGRRSADPAERAQAMALMRDLTRRRSEVQGPNAPAVLLDLLALGMMSIADADTQSAAGQAAYRQALEDLIAADRRIAADPAQSGSRVALAINMLIGLQQINEGRGEAAYWRLKYSGQVARERSLDRRVADTQSAALAELTQYREIFVGQVRAGWLWAHEP